jgi:hypothetical protein
MKNSKLFLFMVAPLLTFSAHAFDLKDCQTDAKVQSFCEIDLSNLRPTQMSVGMIVVKKKAKKIKAKDDSEYKDYLQSHPIPVVIGNGGQFYILDHHHLSRAVYEIGKKKVIATVVQNWNQLPADQFWARMKANHYAYLINADGTTSSPGSLPRYIQQLSDDPYRSLSGEVRDEGGFTKGNVYYIEFIWAQFFRSRIPVSLIQDHFKEAVKEGTRLAHSSVASSMPGYSPVKVQNPD